MKGLVGNVYEIVVPFNRRFIIGRNGERIHEQMVKDSQVAPPTKEERLWRYLRLNHKGKKIEVSYE